MEKTARLITVDSYYGIFSALSRDLKNKPTSIECKNLVFTEEKVSLMTERSICAELNGTFNTEVFSFGKFLRSRKPQDKILSREGSSMALKRIIHDLPLKCFSQSKNQLASSLYDLLILLKSASLTKEDIMQATSKTDGVLKNKLSDISIIFDAYEDFISTNGFVDQSTALSLLPKIIEEDIAVKNADIYLVGYLGWTKQAREIVSALLRTAKSVTAILPNGVNQKLFVGETADMFKRLCRENGVSLKEEKVKSDRNETAKNILDTMFSPLDYPNEKFNTDSIYISNAPTLYDEVMRVAETIKATVMQKGARYSDILVAVPDESKYADIIHTCFELLDIPCFIDQEKAVSSHPLVRLIKAYYDTLRKNCERTSLSAFIKNPLFCDDKKFIDAFENYIIKYNINFDKIQKPFTIEGIDLDRANAIREKVVGAISLKNEKAMLDYLGVEEKLTELTLKLKKLGKDEEADINDQMYLAIVKILDEMHALLLDTPVTLKEKKDIFYSGVLALKLSVIPQYTDAVFVGGYREACLSSPKYTFMLGLTNAVPGVREDVAILTDAELDRLESVKVLVEPKISIINKRELEYIGMTASSFTDKLFLSYPLSTDDGNPTAKSELIHYFDDNFTVSPLNYACNSLTPKQALNYFAKECSDFVSLKTSSNKLATSFYQAVNSLDGVLDKDLPNKILETANKELKLKLDGDRNTLFYNEVSATLIEGFYSCPYKAFLSRSLRISERENGEVSPVSVGNIAHKIFEIFVSYIEKNPDISFDDAFNYAIEKVKEDPEFSRFTEDESENEVFLRATMESKLYAKKLFDLKTNSLFRTVGYEAGFGDGRKYPAIPLNKGRFKVTGKIDRVDEYENYFRVMDYKTGHFNSTEEGLFTGTSLQLYLYSIAVSLKDGKKPAGMYYLPVDEGFMKDGQKDSFISSGKTLSDLEVLSAQDSQFETTKKAFGVSVTKEGKIKGGSTKESIDSHLKYALFMCENATEQMASGVIAQTPFDGACTYCAFKGMCDFTDTFTRKIKSVDEEIIDQSIKEKGEDQNG